MPFSLKERQKAAKQFIDKVEPSETPHMKELLVKRTWQAPEGSYQFHIVEFICERNRLRIKSRP